MATVITLVHPSTGIIKKGFYGFSWTTLFFGPFPAFFRGDLLTGAIVLGVSLITGWIFPIIWAFLYNKRYTLGLLEQGYCFNANDSKVPEAKNALGVSQMH